MTKEDGREKRGLTNLRTLYQISHCDYLVEGSLIKLSDITGWPSGGTYTRKRIKFRDTVSYSTESIRWQQSDLHVSMFA